MVDQEQDFRGDWSGDEFTYHLSTHQMANQDAVMLKVIRYREVGDPSIPTGHQYLSRNGWVDYQEYDIFRDPIVIPGAYQRHVDEVDRRVIAAMGRALSIEPHRADFPK